MAKYKVVPLADIDHAYVVVPALITEHDHKPDAEAAVKAGFEATGIIPDVIVDGMKVQLFHNEVVGRWAVKREPKPLDLGDDLV